MYRILDTLIANGLVAQEVESRGFVFRAHPAKALEDMVEKKKHEVVALESLLPELITGLKTNTEHVERRVVYYKGIEGLKQVTWNSLKALGKVYIYEMVPDVSFYLPKDFAEEVRSEFVKRKVHIKQITNLTAISPYTNVTELVERYWEVRHVDPKVLKLSYEVLVYNDVVVMYNVRGKSVFCVEIYDTDLAAMQKQLFNFVWNMGKKMKIIDSHGGAVI